MAANFASMDQASPSNKSSASGDKSRDSSPLSELPSNRSKAGIRVSLACVPCRSKHIKCDATLPVCQRCQAEQKPCYYAKSRRGIRDPKKRSMMAIEKSPPAMDPPVDFWPIPQMSNFHVPIRFLDDLSGTWNMPSRQAPDASLTSATITLLDSYYTHFYDANPWSLPKHYMISHISGAPKDAQFLVSVFCYIGSLVEPTISSDELRDAAYNEGLGILSPTVFTVQGLLTLSIAALGEAKPDLSGALMDRSIQIALDLGMQHRSFAEAEPDPIVAESYRRTFWGLYTHDCLRASRNSNHTFRLLSVSPTTDIPCEEWEYQSGLIPRPVSLAEYDNRDPVDEPDYSSWAYYIELCKIIGEMYFPLKLSHDSPWYEQSNRVEIRIMNWLLRIPKWKHDFIGPNGNADWVIHMAMGLAHVTRIKLRQPHERAQLGMLREGFAMGPLERPEVPVDPKLSWNFSPPELQICSTLCDLIKKTPIAMGYWSPVIVAGLDRIAVGLLDACVFLGCDTPAVREKLSFVFAVLKRHGEVWPLARHIAADVKEIARTYLPPSPRNVPRGSSGTGLGNHRSSSGTGPVLPGGAAGGHTGGRGTHNWQQMVMPPSSGVAPVPVSVEHSFYPPFAPVEVQGFDDWVVGD